MSQSYLRAHDLAAKAILDRCADADTVGMLEGDDSYLRAWIAGAETVQSIYERVFERKGPDAPAEGGEG